MAFVTNQLVINPTKLLGNLNDESNVIAYKYNKIDLVQDQDNMVTRL